MYHPPVEAFRLGFLRKQEGPMGPPDEFGKPVSEGNPSGTLPPEDGTSPNRPEGLHPPRPNNNYPTNASLAFVNPALSPTLYVTASGAIRLISPASTVPEPHSMNVV